MMTCIVTQWSTLKGQFIKLESNTQHWVHWTTYLQLRNQANDFSATPIPFLPVTRHS